MREEFSREHLGFLLIFSALAIPFLGFSAILWWGIRSPLYVGEDPREVEISRGTGFLEIGSLLRSNGVIRSEALFRLYVIGRGWAGNLKPGKYVFSGSVSIPAVARMLLDGPGDVEFTVPEGATITEIEAGLVRGGFLEPGELIAVAHAPSIFEEEFPFLVDLGVENLEGFLFPDTYKLNQDMDAEDIIRKFLRAFRDKVFDQFEEQFRDSPRALRDIIIMASMLEKESANPEDRRIISGILWKRLETDMPLQVDATVIYAWKQINPNWSIGQSNRLSSNDLKIKSPYNTYSNRGLPPTPIGNPGLDAIRAALEPRDSDYWYYLSPGDGKTLFAKTFDEHTALKAKYFK